jgi:hypothetical protein
MDAINPVSASSLAAPVIANGGSGIEQAPAHGGDRKDCKSTGTTDLFDAIDFDTLFPQDRPYTFLGRQYPRRDSTRRDAPPFGSLDELMACVRDPVHLDLLKTLKNHVVACEESLAMVVTLLQGERISNLVDALPGLPPDETIELIRALLRGRLAIDLDWYLASAASIFRERDSMLRCHAGKPEFIWNAVFCTYADNSMKGSLRIMERELEENIPGYRNLKEHNQQAAAVGGCNAVGD